MQEVRVRFAPSPTGALHIGGVRTALFNYFFAKKHHGKFLIRIEDTDQNRYVAGAEQYIFDALRWVGINSDESAEVGGNYAPYRQSERGEIYKKYIKEILKTDFAYLAFDSNEELDQIRKEYEQQGKVFSYGIFTRNLMKNSLTLHPNEVEKLLQENVPYVVRFKIPENRTIVVKDTIRGAFTVESDTLDDKVLYKADGMPTYHFANVIDDFEMKISHVIRGEEWLPSLPLHLLLYEAMNWNAPQFAHLPLILKPEGNGKLSKRDGDKYGFPVFPLQFTDAEGKTALGYKEFGYFPEAVVNLLALIGWNNKDNQEIFTLNELIEKFDLDEVQKSGARFNPEKAVWFNHIYLQQKSNQELTENLQAILKEKKLPISDEKDSKVIALVKERLHFVTEVLQDNEKGKFFYVEPEIFAETDIKKAIKEDTKALLSIFEETLETFDFQEDKLQNHLKEFAEIQQIGLGKIMMPLRLSLVGEMKGPEIPKIMEILGKEESKKRIRFLLKEI